MVVFVIWWLVVVWIVFNDLLVGLGFGFVLVCLGFICDLFILILHVFGWVNGWVV